VGDDDTLIAEILPLAANQAVTWTSNNPSIATVDTYGVVTGIAPGVVVIAATAVDGGLRATTLVTVRNRAVEGITIDGPTNLEVYETGDFTAAIYPGTATNQNVTWITSNPNIATIDENGVLTALSPGNVTITARSVSNPSVVSNAIMVTVEMPAPAAITGFNLPSMITISRSASGGTHALVTSANVIPSHGNLQSIEINPMTPTALLSDEGEGVVRVNGNGRVIVTVSAPGVPPVTVIIMIIN